MNFWEINATVPFSIPISVAKGYLPNKDQIINSIEYIENDSHFEDLLYCRRSGNLLNKKNFNSLTLQIIKNFLNINECIYQYDFNKVKPYVTSMWANKYTKNQFVPSHIHPNSWFSGIYYPYGTGTTQTIFENPTNYTTINPTIKNYNPYNSHTFSSTFPEDTMVFFPSYLRHKTTKHQDSIEKISISFNIFLRGKISGITETFLEI